MTKSQMKDVMSKLMIFMENRIQHKSELDHFSLYIGCGEKGLVQLQKLFTSEYPQVLGMLIE